MTQRHSWTEQELWVVCVCYKEKIPAEVALRLTNTTNKKSIEMRYQNCLFLEKGRVDGALSHPSRVHEEVWTRVEELYRNVVPAPVPAPVPEPVVEKESNVFCEFLALVVWVYIIVKTIGRMSS